MTKASVNFKAVKSASHAVSHASRSVEPTYLLPEGKSLGTICLLDDRGNVASVIEAKMALASRQALRQGDYSPVWEGVINLPRPGVGCDVSKYKRDCKSIISEWCQSYQKMTGHTVLRADIHLDEGHVVDGETLLNAHAHVICDKTNEKGRVIKINAPELRKIQDMTAKVTGLDRGESSLKTGRKHIDHQAYKYLAERGRLETQQQVFNLKGTHENQLDIEKGKTARIQKLFAADTPIISNLKAEITQLKAQYDQDRATLKASGEATQKAYQALKAAHEGALAELKKSNHKAEKMDEYTQKLNAELAQKDAQIASELVAKARVIEALVKSGEKSDALLVTADGHRAAAIKLTGELAEVKAKFATMAKAYEAHKAAGLPAADFVPGAPAMTPNEAMGVAWWNRLVPQERRQWLAEAKSAIPADAWAAFQGKDMGVEGQKQTPTPFKPITEPTKTAPEPLSEAEAPTAPPAQTKSPRDAFMAFYEGVKVVLVGLIDGMRLDAAAGRLGLFSAHSRSGQRVQVLCEVPDDKVMPAVGQLFDSRAVPGQGHGGLGS